ncbi:unnamed protein product [Cylindrotheca closterium]|uniref:TRAM domain-containing protein n=1 Tax=Cylindrotheca closterium TaxID=2856 RepID=A0AAD2CLT8_9STRA|nr:unnamed protein product [Cylindrotheca closterium]
MKGKIPEVPVRRTTADGTVIPIRFVDKPFPYHYELKVRIDSWNDMGWGLGHLEDDSETLPEHPENWGVRVPMVLPGELVTVKVFKNMDDYSEGDLVNVLEPSEDRIEPQCPLAGKCGGCQFQHMKIEKQREWKSNFVTKGLVEHEIEGYKGIDDISAKLLPVAGTDEIYGYRSKITPHYEAPTKVGDDEYEMEEIGFQQFMTKRLVDVEECPIATPAINAKFKETRVELHKQAKEGLLNNRKKRKRHRRSRNKELGATLLFRHADDDENGNPVVVTDNKEYMTTTVKGIKFRYVAGNFFQNNNYVLPLMVDGVLSAALKPSASGKVPSHLIDCYCGSGLFALSAASNFQLCVGIEVQEKAIEEATFNAEANNIKNCQFVAASAEAIFASPHKVKMENGEEQSVSDFPRDQTVVVVDPPRKGCSGAFLEQLYAYSPQRVVYMSCGPATQARDAKGLVEVGGYEIVSIQPFDLFPQTKHIECLMVFEKR